MSRPLETAENATPIADMMAVMLISENALERIRVLALEWHGKHLTDQRFSVRVYEILYEYEKAIKELDKKQ